jgi:hypothetical protein
MELIISLPDDDEVDEVGALQTVFGWVMSEGFKSVAQYCVLVK